MDTYLNYAEFLNVADIDDDADLDVVITCWSTDKVV